MKTIYLRNFKGFKEQFIPLKAINFLVGENSTGKTSLLKVINILSDMTFFARFNFNNGQVENGYFDEILNKNSYTKTFRVGFEKLQKGITIRLVMEFKKANSIPTISSLKFSDGKTQWVFKFGKNNVSYIIQDSEQNTFEIWAKDFKTGQEFQKLEINSIRLYPLFLLLAISENHSRNKKEDIASHFDEIVLFERLRWMAPIRAKPQRLYEPFKNDYSPEGEHIPSLIRELFFDRNKKEIERTKRILTAFGRESNLFEDIEINEFDNQSPFEIIIKFKNLDVKLPNVGYGVSQVLPLVIDILSSKASVFSIQQPEVHLHPKAQAAFGSFLYNAIVKDKNSFIIETHSDYTINRFRYELSKNPEQKIDSQILFFERDNTENKITKIDINHDGSYKDSVPMSYREFFIYEELKLLEL